MSKKRIIACWLLVVYLVTAVGPACASLSCRCAFMEHRTEAVCCAHHGHAHPAHACDRLHQPAAGSSCDAREHASGWEAPCCGDRHSTEIDLYTPGGDDRSDKLLLPVTAALLPDDLPVAAPALAGSARLTDRHTRRLCHGSVHGTGLRAPPARY